jgi:hypothetical protein
LVIIALVTAGFAAFVILGGSIGDIGDLMDGVMEPEPVVCPLTGLETTASPDRIPIAVAIDNVRQARPQAGLDKADIVYEMLAEGGIPRFLALYYCAGDSEDRIGPVRSARTYFISVAGQFDAALAHAGGSPQALREIEAGRIHSLDQFRFGEAYQRDRLRRAPYNLYTSTAQLRGAAEGAGFSAPGRLEGPRFETPQSLGTEPYSIQIPYPTTRVTYEYTPSTGEYARFMDGAAHRDEVSGEQLTVKNVIIQFARHSVVDERGRLGIDLVGTGDAIFFTGGRRIEGSWIRDSESDAFRYEDAGGNPVTFVPGQSWVQIVRTGTNVTGGPPGN